MSDVKHTALPWHRGTKTSNWWHIVGDNDMPVAKISSQHRANHREATDFDIEEGNARYIVRACNAYPALVEALLTIAMADESVFGYDHPERKMIEIARSALAQAQGDE